MLEKYLKILGGAKKQESEAKADEGPPTIPLPPRGAPAAGEGDVDTTRTTGDAVVANVLPVETNGAPVDVTQAGQRFLAREPVLDRGQHIVGYEFRLRGRSVPGDSTLTRMYDETLVRAILALDTEKLFGNRLAFLCISGPILDDPLLETLPKPGLVLSVRLSSEEAVLRLPRLKELAAMGYNLALDDVQYSVEIEPLLKLVRYVRLDAARLDALALRGQAAAVLKKASPLLMATGVEGDEAFEVCRTLSFNLFQGYYFARMRPQALPRMENNHATVMQLLNLVTSRAEIGELEKVFKRDAALSYNLLRYINSPGCGLLQTVRSIAHALIILGYDQLYRWLTLLLFSCGKQDPRMKALLKNALVRARLVEMLGTTNLPANAREGLFIAGIFSLLDVLLNMPMHQAIGNLNLPPPVTEALLHGAGIYAPYLALAIACEEADQERAAAMAARCGLDAAAVNDAHMQALLWAEEVDPG